jgi:hypothetical protein
VRVYVRAVAVGADPALIGQALLLRQPGAVELNVEVTLEQGGELPQGPVLWSLLSLMD